MTDGTATGMITAGELKAELDRKRAVDREQFARLDAATTGRGAETVGFHHTSCAVWLHPLVTVPQCAETPMQLSQTYIRSCTGRHCACLSALTVV
jgi:hypothetical protein